MRKINYLRFGRSAARSRRPTPTGFSLIEVVLGIALIGTALLGLAQLFVFSLSNNTRADRISTATFLAREQVDQMRALTADELQPFADNLFDETLDVNNDGNDDYRRITWVLKEDFNWKVRVWVFTSSQEDVDAATLVAEKTKYGVLADVSSVVCR